MKYRPDFILVDKAAEHLPATQEILSKFNNIDTTVIEDVSAVKRPADFSAAKRQLLITINRGDAFKPCQGIAKGHLCCNYWIIDLISNCPMDCSYCILQHYLENNPMLTIYANIDEILDKTSVFVSKNKDRKFRVGTGELSDSLALDHITGFSKKLIEFFSTQSNVELELKTKTTNISHLLKLNHNEKTILAWSVNPERIVKEEEIGAASLAERFKAAQSAIDAGYKIAFHFDPIIFSESWEEEYKTVVDQIIDSFQHGKIAWISLGTLRYPPQMKDIVMKRFPKSRIFYNEFVPVNGKVRYFRPIREEIYAKMLGWLQPLKKTTPTYFCMETETVWQKLMPNIGTSNRAIEHYLIDF